MIEDTIEPSDPKFGDITDYSSSDESIVESSTNNHPKSNPFYRHDCENHNGESKTYVTRI